MMMTTACGRFHRELIIETGHADDDGLENPPKKTLILPIKHHYTCYTTLNLTRTTSHIIPDIMLVDFFPTLIASTFKAFLLKFPI